jgi:hypothetical protein
VQPKGSKNIYSFSRKDVVGNDSKFYVCNMDGLVSMDATEEGTMITTVANNMVRYTKREVFSAKKARELLARLGHPSVENAIAMLRDGTGFTVTPYDFQVANAIWGASIEGKTTRAKSMVSDATLGVPII